MLRSLLSPQLFGFQSSTNRSKRRRPEPALSSHPEELDTSTEGHEGRKLRTEGRTKPEPEEHTRTSPNYNLGTTTDTVPTTTCYSSKGAAKAPKLNMTSKGQSTELEPPVPNVPVTVPHTQRGLILLDSAPTMMMSPQRCSSASSASSSSSSNNSSASERSSTTSSSHSHTLSQSSSRPSTAQSFMAVPDEHNKLAHMVRVCFCDVVLCCPYCTHQRAAA